MPVVIEVELLTGRYHAHVWGEAQFAMAGPEWPPSPWRLLRALASAWFEARPAPSTSAKRDALLEALGRSAPPELWLPVTAFREIRYYHPLEQKRALHHDFFAVPAGGRFYFVWDQQAASSGEEALLSREHERLLDALLRRVQYFGRAESHATLRRVALTAPPSGFFRALPRDRVAAPGWVPRPVLCPSIGRDFRASDLWLSRAMASRKQSKRRERAADTTGVPLHLVDALLADRKPLPDGCLRVEYAQPDGSVVREIPAAKPPPCPPPEMVKVSSVRFRFCRRIPIPIGEIVAVARAYRDEAVRIYKAVNPGAHSRALTGHEDDGSVSRGDEHVYYQPRPSGRGLEISAFVVTVPPGSSLTRAELDALMAVERVSLRWNDRYPITVIPEVASDDSPPRSRRWRSLTPFLPPYHHRPGRGDTLSYQQLLACVRDTCGLTALRVGPMGGCKRTLVRVHEYGSAVPGASGARTWRFTPRFAQWFTVDFSTPVVFSRALGKDAHFGLGQFAPE
jgi:CRISPR-associated protein Csb2